MNEKLKKTNKIDFLLRGQRKLREDFDRRVRNRMILLGVLITPIVVLPVLSAAGCISALGGWLLWSVVVALFVWKCLQDV